MFFQFSKEPFEGQVYEFQISFLIVRLSFYMSMKSSSEIYQNLELEN